MENLKNCLISPSTEHEVMKIIYRQSEIFYNYACNLLYLTMPSKLSSVKLLPLGKSLLTALNTSFIYSITAFIM